jgi:hypothetical protein
MSGRSPRHRIRRDPRGAVVADIGFGGAVGLQLLLDRVGDDGVVPHGFTIRPVGDIAAALQNSGLQVEQRRIDEKPMPRYLFIGRRP